MAFARFYGHFAAAYGTFWLVLMAAALMTQSHLDAGEFGLYGFPVIALVYAFVRMSTDRPSGKPRCVSRSFAEFCHTSLER